MLNPGTERAIIRLADNIGRLIEALDNLKQVFVKVQPLLESLNEQLKKGGEEDDARQLEQT